MAFAVKQKQKIATRSGGHSYIGTSGAKGKLVLDLRRLEGGAGYDPATGLARVTPAGTLYDVANVLGEQGRPIPVGTCATVGEAGLTLGGGLGVDSRQYGFTCDMLTAATMVLPTGEAITVTSGVTCSVLLVCPTGAGRRIAADISAAVGVVPSGSDYLTLDPMATLLRLAGGATVLRHGFVAGSDIVAQITDPVAAAIVTAVRNRSRSGAAGLVIIDPLDAWALSARNTIPGGFSTPV